MKKLHYIDFVSLNTLMLILNIILTCLPIIAPQNSVQILIKILVYNQIHKSAIIMIEAMLVRNCYQLTHRATSEAKKIHQYSDYNRSIS